MKYGIEVNSDAIKIKKVLESLFLRGFVFDSHFRIRDFDKFYSVFGAHNYFFCWEWISIGDDNECKMVLNALCDLPTDLTPISLEDFLKLEY